MLEASLVYNRTLSELVHSDLEDISCHLYQCQNSTASMAASSASASSVCLVSVGVFMGLPSFMLRNWFLMLRFTLPSIQVTPLIWRIPCQHLVWLLVQEDNSKLHLALVVSQPVFLVACTRKFLCILFIVIVP